MSSTSERTGGKVGEDEHSQKEKTEADNYTHKFVGRVVDRRYAYIKSVF